MITGCSFIYLVLSYIIINRVSKSFVKPILSLTRQIGMSIRNIKKLRREVDKQDSTYKENVAGFASLQIDMLSGNYRKNQEMTNLYHGFSQRVKVLFFANSSAKDKVDTQYLFNMYEAMKVYKDMKNLRGEATCLYILGCLYSHDNGITQFDFNQNY